jgi:hypothetical protein
MEPLACGNDENQFRLLFTPDVQNWPAYKHPASNPGQFFYNLVYESTTGFTETVDITVDYPFITQGAVPVHVYCAEDVALYTDENGFQCFDPVDAQASIRFAITIDDYIEGTTDTSRLNLYCTEGGICGPDGEGSCTFDVDLSSLDLSACDLDQVYINVHLDWALKGPMVDANPCDDGLPDRYDMGANLEFGGFDALENTDTEDGHEAITNCRTFEFSHTDGGYTSDSAGAQNYNVFKPIAGAFGLVQHSTSGDPAQEGLSVSLVKSSTGEVIKTGSTDEDGFWITPYKHKGKPTMYTINVDYPSCETMLGSPFSQEIELQGNGWSYVTFDADTCTSTAEYGTGRNKRKNK